LQAAGIKVAPTGLDHGTVTAIADGKGFEITTLRRDVETDGRRAKVEFTDDWQADAARRDFTMNAIYAEADGTLHDYFGGRDDLAKGYVRFIGKPDDRIKEDVLRILRFFRFYAWFGDGSADTDGLKACREQAGLLPHLSIERVWREVHKWLGAVDPGPSWRLAIEQAVLPRILPEADNVGRLEHLIAAEIKFDTRASPIARLAALLPQKAEIAGRVARKLKMSNKDAEQLNLLAVVPGLLIGKLDPLPFRHALYNYGAEICRNAALLRASDDRAAELEPALSEAADWKKPAFPVSGDDLQKLGQKPGPEMGETLRAVEDWWIARDFRPTRDECLEEAKRQIA